MIMGTYVVFVSYLWGPGRYLDGSGAKNVAKVTFRIGIWWDMLRETVSEHFRKMGSTGRRDLRIGQSEAKLHEESFGEV